MVVRMVSITALIQADPSFATKNPSTLIFPQDHIHVGVICALSRYTSPQSLDTPYHGLVLG